MDKGERLDRALEAAVALLEGAPSNRLQVTNLNKGLFYLDLVLMLLYLNLILPLLCLDLVLLILYLDLVGSTIVVVPGPSRPYYCCCTWIWYYICCTWT